MKIFDYITAICKTKDFSFYDSRSEEDKKVWNNFAIVKFLSYNFDLLPFSDVLNIHHHKISNNNLFRGLTGMIPKGYYPMSFPKKGKKDKERDTVVDYICQCYKIPYATGNEYYDMLTDAQKTIILEQFGLSPKEIKKLL